MILTAAHCVTDSRFPLDIVRLGAHDLSNDEEESADDYQIEEIHVHPSYVKAPFYDIAIIVLKTEGKNLLNSFMFNLFGCCTNKEINLV